MTKLPLDKNWFTNEEYNYIYSSVPRFCVDVIVITNKWILLAKRKIQPYRWKWHLPGGRIKFREPIDKWIKRIVKEETWIEVNAKKMIGFMEFLRESQNKSPRHSISLVFLANSAIDTNEYRDYWTKFHKTLPKTMLNIHKKFLEDKLKFNKKWIELKVK